MTIPDIPARCPWYVALFKDLIRHPLATIAVGSWMMILALTSTLVAVLTGYIDSPIKQMAVAHNVLLEQHIKQNIQDSAERLTAIRIHTHQTDKMITVLLEGFYLTNCTGMVVMTKDRRRECEILLTGLRSIGMKRFDDTP